MPVVLDPDAAAVYKAFQEAGRPAYESLTADEARAYYAQARFATNPDAPELARVAPLAIPAPHGPIPARIYVTEAATSAAWPVARAGVLPRRRLGDRRSRLPRRRLPPARRRWRAGRDIDRLSPRARAQISRAADGRDRAATKWIAANARELASRRRAPLDARQPRRRNLAAVVALAARDGDGSEINPGQVLIYPATDFAMTPCSAQRARDHRAAMTHSGYPLVPRSLPQRRRRHPRLRASPATRRKTLPVCAVPMCSLQRRSPARRMRRIPARLKRPGVPVAYNHYPVSFHVFFTMGKLLQQANSRR